jgi:hypothetical protein
LPHEKNIPFLAVNFAVFMGFDPGRWEVAQIGSGKIFGSVGFVVGWIGEMGFSSKRAVAHAVGNIGYSSHGWRLAKRDAALCVSTKV